MTLHNLISDSHWEDYDFVQWQNDDDGEGEGEGEGEEADCDGDEEEEGDNDDSGGRHIVYESTGDRSMEFLRKNITNEYGRCFLLY